jgi:hypothetical protein
MGYLHQVGAAFIGIAVAAGLAPQASGRRAVVVGDERRAHLPLRCGGGGGVRRQPGVVSLNVRGSLSSRADGAARSGGRAAGELDGGAGRCGEGSRARATRRTCSPICRRCSIRWPRKPSALTCRPAGPAPAFDVLQLEDYDWVTGGHTALSKAGAAAAQSAARLRAIRAALSLRVSCSIVRDAHTQWPLIEDGGAGRSGARRGADLHLGAAASGARRLHPFFTLGAGDDMQAFDDELFPLSIGSQASVTPAFSTQTVESLSGHERRTSDWGGRAAAVRCRAGCAFRGGSGDAGGVSSGRRRGAARAFASADPFDTQSAPLGQSVSAVDQKLGTGDGVTSEFRLAKYYGSGCGRATALHHAPGGGYDPRCGERRRADQRLAASGRRSDRFQCSPDERRAAHRRLPASTCRCASPRTVWRSIARPLPPVKCRRCHWWRSANEPRRHDIGARSRHALAFCWRLERRDGVTIGLTSHDRDLVVGGRRL